jgi:ubiquinol-cytochrome c reductase cytochrome b subunit
MSKGSGRSREGEIRGLGAWLDRHFQWRKFLDTQVLGKFTIGHRSGWDYLGYTGTIALALIIFQALSGLLLLLYYTPDPDKAFASLQMIRNDVPSGLPISNLHSINAKLILLLLFVHMFRVMIISAHRGPREPQWYSGAVLLFLMLLTGFSGYLLPWSQQSYWAVVIGTEAARALPIVGDGLVGLLRGGEAVTGATLHRFFALHVTLLPVCIIVLVWLHVKWVWRTGVIAPPDMFASVIEDDCIGCGKCERVCQFEALGMREREGRKLPRINADKCNACRACEKECPADCITFKSEKRPFLTEPIFPHNLINRAKGVVFALIALFFGVFFMYGTLMRVKTPADPLMTPDMIKPDWYFLAAYQALRELPSEGLGLLALVAVSLLVLSLPAIDASGPRELRRRPVYLFLVIGGILSFIILTIRGMF